MQFESAAAQTSGAGPAIQPALPADAPKSWVERAAHHQLAIVQDQIHPLRYVIRKQDRRGDITREVLESAEGNVARLIERNGKPITGAEDAAERSRLNDILSSPNDFLRHQQRESASRNYAIQLIKLIPSAMIFNYTPGQPQPNGATSTQVVIDFRPDPSFHPPTMISELLTGLAGRAWIDARTGTMTRIQGDFLRPVNVGWGVVARIYGGGHIEFEQTCVEGKRWAYSQLDENLTVREVMLRTVNDKSKMTAWNFQLLPAPISFQDAVHALLAEQIPLQ